MKRFHVNIHVADIDRSVQFYSTLFGTPPTTLRDDYAKWMLDDPRVNFALSTHGEGRGVDHVGLQAGDDSEFAEIRARLAGAESPVFDQPDVTCCYARSTKAWVRDPDGLAWETFLTRENVTVYGDGSQETAVDFAGAPSAAAACCEPRS